MGRPGPQDIIRARQSNLRTELEANRLQAMLVTRPPDIFYLTGFRGSAGVLALGRDEARLWVDPRYSLQAREQVSGIDVVEERGDLLKAADKWLRKRAGVRAGYDPAMLTCAEFSVLKEAAGGRVRWIEAPGLVEKLRVVKDLQEIELIEQACRVTVRALEAVVPAIRPGVREIELAAEIEYRMKGIGAEGPAFETIVASGARSAWPHARASSKCLQEGELVILDLGAILGGYAADMTRTFFLGRPPARVRELYRAVREAQAKGIAAAKAGKTAGSVDAATRRALARRGLGRYFTHSTGHGVGIEIHERPRLGRKEKVRLAERSVVTVEPGVYLEGLGGVRIEDTILIGQGAAEMLTSASKDDWIIA